MSLSRAEAPGRRESDRHSSTDQNNGRLRPTPLILAASNGAVAAFFGHRLLLNPTVGYTRTTVAANPTVGQKAELTQIDRLGSGKRSNSRSWRSEQLSPAPKSTPESHRKPCHQMHAHNDRRDDREHFVFPGREGKEIRKTHSYRYRLLTLPSTPLSDGMSRRPSPSRASSRPPVNARCRLRPPTIQISGAP
jgi:hypothetical protein